MNEMLLSVVILVSTTGAPPALQSPRAVSVPSVFTFELPETAPSAVPVRFQGSSFDPPTERRLVRSAPATKAKRSRMDQVIAIAAGLSIGWVVGGGIGFAVTPKRGPYDDTSGLKGMMIGAPIGATAGALIGWRLTK